MTATIRGHFPLVLAIGICLGLGAQPSALAKWGAKISVRDDPSMKEGSPGLVLVEVSDFQ
jgi:hypothetical protein